MRKETRTILIQVALFIATFVTTTLAGAEWTYGKSLFFGEFTWQDFLSGMEFSIPLLLILTVHEFGHYFMAKFHKIRSSLPYYLPFPPNPILPSIGTLGAVIRIRDMVRSNKEHFDIGLAGPLAGFIVALFILGYGYFTLPTADYVFKFHPDYKQYGADYADHVYSEEYLKGKSILDLQIGSSLLFKIFEAFVPDKSRIPNGHEIMHYPLLMAGAIALFFTCMNLLPIGQLDGGHITYGLFKWRGHKIIASVFLVIMLFYTGLGAITIQALQGNVGLGIPLSLGFYYICLGALRLRIQDRIMYTFLIFAAQLGTSWLFPHVKGYMGWGLFVFIVSRFIGVEHPHSEIEEALDTKRIVLGWIGLLIFILCFSPEPLTLEVLGETP